MLVLSRKPGERIMIGENIAITVVRISQGTVRIGVEAPRDMAVIREEVASRDNALPEKEAFEIFLPVSALESPANHI